MPKPFTFELVSPEKLVFSGEAEMVVIPAEEGDLGVLAEHAPLIATVRPGVIRVYNNGAVSQRVFVPVEETVKGFKGIVKGDYDYLPEAAFYMVGTIEQAVTKGESLMKAAA